MIIRNDDLGTRQLPARSMPTEISAPIPPPNNETIILLDETLDGYLT